MTAPTDAQSTGTSANCLFCRIVSGQIPARLAYQDDEVVAFHDISPQAPVHVLVIPRKHVVSLDASTPEDDAVLAKVLAAVRHLGRELGVATTGYRTVLNTGPHAGQSVFHLHAHLLGGRPLGWPPG